MHLSDVGVLLIRASVGGIFAAHGAQKAFGWWSGPGRDGWHGAMERMGFQPAWLFAWTSIANELVGGALIALGLLTPFAAAILVAQSIVIVARVHWARGFFTAGGGIEFPLALGIASLAVLLIGAGALSLDAVLKLAWPAEIRVAIAILGGLAGVAAAIVPSVVRRQQRVPVPGPVSNDKLRRT